MTTKIDAIQQHWSGLPSWDDRGSSESKHKQKEMQTLPPKKSEPPTNQKQYLDILVLPRVYVMPILSAVSTGCQKKKVVTGF